MLSSFHLQTVKLAARPPVFGKWVGAGSKPGPMQGGGGMMSKRLTLPAPSKTHRDVSAAGSDSSSDKDERSDGDTASPLSSPMGGSWREGSLAVEARRLATSWGSLAGSPPKGVVQLNGAGLWGSQGGMRTVLLSKGKGFDGKGRGCVVHTVHTTAHAGGS